MNKVQKYFANCSKTNLYSLEGTVPFFKAVPHSFQHVLALLLSNITPILLILANPSINKDSSIVTMGIQNSLMLAGVGTLIQLFPIWKIGSKLPLFVGMNFAFMAVINYIGTVYGYNTIASSVIIGSLFFIIVSLFLKKILMFIPKISSSIVVFILGVSLIINQLNSIPFLDNSFYSFFNITIIIITILIFVGCTFLFRGKLKSISLLLSLVGGYLTAVIFKKVDFTPIVNSNIITYPKVINIMDMEFNINAIISVSLIFLISITDIIGAVEIIDIACDDEKKKAYMANASFGVGIISCISGFFGCIPLTTFAQNAGIVKSSKVINRYTLALGALLLIVLSFFPIVSAFVLSIPSIILSVISIMLFVSILTSGITMLKKTEKNFKNIIIIMISVVASLMLAYIPGIFDSTSNLIKSIGTNAIVISFLVSLLLYYIIPNKVSNEEKKNEKK